MFANGCLYRDHCQSCRDEGGEHCCWCDAPITTGPSTPPTPRRAVARLRAITPWRLILAVDALILMIPVGIAAAAPGWNGADFAALIVLAMFVAAFIPGRNRA